MAGFVNNDLVLLAVLSGFSSYSVKAALCYGATIGDRKDRSFKSGFSHYDNELPTGSGYIKGGITIASFIFQDSITGATIISSVNPKWVSTGVGFTADSCVFFLDRADFNFPILKIIDFPPGFYVVAGQTFKISSNGIILRYGKFVEV